MRDRGSMSIRKLAGSIPAIADFSSVKQSASLSACCRYFDGVQPPMQAKHNTHASHHVAVAHVPRVRVRPDKVFGIGRLIREECDRVRLTAVFVISRGAVLSLAFWLERTALRDFGTHGDAT